MTSITATDSATDTNINKIMLTIPIRQPPLPKSLVDDPVFKLLYSNKDMALADFLFFKNPLATNTVTKNPHFIKWVQEQEPGPTVDYDSMRANCTALRRSMSSTKSGKETLEFFKNLLQLRAAWVTTASQFHALTMFSKMFGTLVHGPRDNEFVKTLHAKAPAALQLWNKQITNFSSKDHIQTIKTQWEKLSKTLEDISIQLFDLKVSDKMWSQSAKLYEASEAHAEFMEKVRMEEEKKRKEHNAKRKALKERNTRNVMRQMGMLGTAPFSPGVCAAVEEVACDQRNSFFSYPEEQCIVPSLYPASPNVEDNNGFSFA